MQHTIDKNEIQWRTKIEFVDLETGEKITEEQARKEYVIIKSKKQSHVYKSTGTITFTKQCRRSTQSKLF